MKDHIIRASAYNGMVRVFAATARDMANEARRIHGTTPVATAALTRVLCAAAMASAMLKNDGEQLSIIIRGDGPAGKISVTADSRQNVRGMMENPLCGVPPKPSGRPDVGSAVGRGELVFVRDMGMKEPYTGRSILVSGEIGDDLTYYYAKSEQVPTSVALCEIIDTDLSVLVCGGFIIQMMPGASDELGAEIYQELANLPPVSSLLNDGKSPEDICRMIFPDLELLDTLPLNYKCNCSRGKMEAALLSIGESDLNILLEEDKGAELVCHFCNTRYQFSEDDIRGLIQHGVSDRG